MKVLVTGPFGNIGSHTVPELLRNGHAVRCFARDTPKNRAASRRLGARVELAWGDVRDPGAVGRAVADAEAVLHLAALIPLPRSLRPVGDRGRARPRWRAPRSRRSAARRWSFLARGTGPPRS